MDANCVSGRWNKLTSICEEGFLKIILFIYSFIYSHAESLLLQGLFSSCREQWLLSSWFSSRFTSFSLWRSSGHGLSCSKALGIFFDHGFNSCLLRCQRDSLPLSHEGSPWKKAFKTFLLASMFPNSPLIYNSILA